MAKALLINPSYRDSYGSAKASVVDPVMPTLGLLTIAAQAEKHGHTVEVLDLSYRQYDYRIVRDRILQSKPDVVGITGTTPLMNQMRDISVLVKSISKSILCVAGGPHVTAMPKESLLESMLDMVVVGEGDFTFPEILDGGTWEAIKGICFRRDGGEIRTTLPRPFVETLDDLPLPAWHLYDSREYKYRISRLLARRRPVAQVEFSRGCIYKCDFCASKNTLALGYRKKSPERCVEEVRLIKKLGYREFALADDIFTSDNKWAKAVAEKLIEADLDMLWTCTNGIRVESAAPDLFKAMRKAGCYRVSFGLETGNENVLKAFGKGGKASLEKADEAVAMGRAAGIDVCGFFLLGLSPDTEASMNDTIEFARRLPLDMLKFGVTIAFPGTKMFSEYRKRGLVRSYNWDDYFVYTARPLFSHPNLSFETVQRYAADAYKRAILRNPRFVARRVWRGIRTGEFFWDAYYFVKFFGSPATSATHSAIYFAKDRWPQHDFTSHAIHFTPIRNARNAVVDELQDIAVPAT